MIRSFKATLSAYFFEVASALFARLAPPARYRLARAFGRAFSWVPNAMRRGLETNLDQLFKPTPARRSALVREVFENFALTLCDFFFPDELTVDVADRERLENLRRDHRGVLFLTFHMGNWELGAKVLRQWDWPVTAVYQPYDNERFKAVIQKRRAEGVNFIPVGGHAARGVLEALRRGDAVAMLGDHPFGEAGSVVRLLGRDVVWPRGPVLLAVRERVPIVVAVIVRTEPGRYQAIVHEPLVPANHTRAEADRLAQKIADIFGEVLSNHPTQWYRFRPLDFARAQSTVPAEPVSPGV